MIHTNRGSRASLRLATSETDPKCTIQDATWEINGCAIQLHASAIEDLVIIVKKLCGSDAEFLSESRTLTGHRAGDSLMYEIDACPLRPIGPAQFVFGSSAGEQRSLLILVHPVIHDRIRAQVAKIISEESNVHATWTSCFVTY